eukprot:scaffold221655_cov31-Prasinocladus_malaysianus.AAC.1
MEQPNPLNFEEDLCELYGVSDNLRQSSIQISCLAVSLLETSSNRSYDTRTYTIQQQWARCTDALEKAKG